MTELVTSDEPGCQTAGFHMCASSDPVLASITLPPCCPGLVCREDPELPVTGDKFCMESEAIPEGGDCKVTRYLMPHSEKELAVTFQGKRGVCAEGFRCSNGKCQSVNVTITGV